MLAVLMREADRFESALQKRLSRVPKITDLPVEGILFSVKTARENPRLALLFAPDVAGQTGAFVGASEIVRNLVAKLVKPYLEEGKRQGVVRNNIDADETAELLMRIVISLLSVPSARSVAKERAYLTKFIVPAFLSDGTTDTTAPVVPLVRRRP